MLQSFLNSTTQIIIHDILISDGVETLAIFKADFI